MVHVADQIRGLRPIQRRRALRHEVARYKPLERVLEMFPRPWIAAHMGGWPEDLGSFPTARAPRQPVSRYRRDQMDSAGAQLARSAGGADSSSAWPAAVRSDIVALDEHQSGLRRERNSAQAASAEEPSSLRFALLGAAEPFEGGYHGASPSPIRSGADRSRAASSTPELRDGRFRRASRNAVHDAAHALLEPPWAKPAGGVAVGGADC